MSIEKPCKILVAQDVKSMFDYLQMQVERAHAPFSLEWVDNGQSAVDKIKAGGAYDAILMNITMPRMGGISATKAIRKLGYARPIIAWSAHNRDWQWEACKEAGMNEYVEICPTKLLQDVVVGLTLCGVITD